MKKKNWSEVHVRSHIFLVKKKELDFNKQEKTRMVKIGTGYERRHRIIGNFKRGQNARISFLETGKKYGLLTISVHNSTLTVSNSGSPIGQRKNLSTPKLRVLTKILTIKQPRSQGLSSRSPQGAVR